MARGKAAVVEPEADEAEVKDYTVYASKDATPTMVDFADWLIQEVGLEFKTGKEEDAFRDGVRLGGTLRMEFQKSEFNLERKEERRLAKEAEAAESAKAAKATRGKAKAAEAEDEADADEDEPEDEAPAKPVTRARRPAGTRAAGRSGPTRPTKPTARRGKAAAGAEAPY